jgi:signal transduction histidine kinase
MDKEGLSKLFDPFYTTKRGQGGSGLGAHIVYNLVTGLLGGSIKAQSEENQGLRYQLRIPLDFTKQPH